LIKRKKSSAGILPRSTTGIRYTGFLFVVFIWEIFLGCHPGFTGDDFRNYVLTPDGYNCEIILVNTGILNPASDNTAIFKAYGKDGALLASTNRSGEVANGNQLRVTLKALFPTIEDTGTIGLVEISSSSRKDVWVLYSRGDQRAMVPAPIAGSATVYNLHFTNNTGYWTFLDNIARINNTDCNISAVVYPRLENFAFDGTVNSYGFTMPDLDSSRGSASFNMKDMFGGTVPADAGWMKLKSESFQQKTSAPVNNLVNNTLFMKVNGESGGAFGNPPAFEELIVPHIAADGYYWWTGLVLNNPNSETVKFVIQYYSPEGVHLDVNTTTSVIDDATGQLPAFGKLVDVIQNLGLPDGAGFARIVAEKPIMGGELFGGEPNGADWPIMGGVGLLLPDTGGYLSSVTGMDPPRQRCNIPLADSKDASDGTEGIWTGLAFANFSNRDQNIVLSYQTETGTVLGTQVVTIVSMSKYAETIEALLNSAGLEGIRDDVKQLTVYGSVSESPLSDNRNIMMYALQGGLKLVDGKEVHSWMIGEDTVNTTPLTIHPFIANETRGIATDIPALSGTRNLEVEDNDTLFSHLIIEMRDTTGSITGYDILAFDNSWNVKGTLATFSRTAHPELSANLFRVDFSSGTTVDDNTTPYGTSRIGIRIKTSAGGIDRTWIYRMPDWTITRNPETSLIITNAYTILSGESARLELAEILGRDNITVGNSQNSINTDEAYNYLTLLTNGNRTADNEMWQSNGAVLAKISNTAVFNLTDTSDNNITECFHLPDEKTEREIQLFWENHGAILFKTIRRTDGAVKIETVAGGSIQNPAWSPDGKSILFTRFRNNYNEGPADLFIFDLESCCLKTLVSDGNTNVNLPGSTWNPTIKTIVFSSDREPHDEIYSIGENAINGQETRITNRSADVAYEPSLSPDGQWLVFESHKEDVEENGIITTYRIDGTGSYESLTGVSDDCRQPNWSPAGDLILYQRFSGGQWDIWVMKPDGSNPRMVTSGSGDKTDASFSPDGKWIVYSSDNGELDFANLYILPVSGGTPLRVTNNNGYDGAPSWSPDGTKIVFESCPGDPDNSPGTSIWMIETPAH